MARGRHALSQMRSPPAATLAREDRYDRDTAVYSAAAYGDACAEFYDQLYGSVPAAMVTSLIVLAGDGRVLELGSATGRMALALHEAGLQHYVGVEASTAMIEVMRRKPHCSRFDIVHGDFGRCLLPGRFDLIFALVSTFQLLPSAAQQAAAFAHLARHLSPGGTLLLECFDALAVEDRDRSRQTRHRVITRAGECDYPVIEFHSTRATLDAMAAAAGLQLAARWSDWQRRHDTGQLQHISLYRWA
jgi:SAM-dependent methyltransferase